MADSIIQIENVSKFYKLYDKPENRLKEALHPFGKKYHKVFHVLKAVDLKIRKGDMIGIVGKNGSGKSTLLKIISGILTPNSGSVKVQGKISALLELGSGFNPDFTGMQNIYFYGTILGLSKSEIKSKVQEIVDFADIGDYINQPVKSYSSGMKARLGFAVAINVDPDILILDEVLAVGDALFQRKCFVKMEEFFKSGKTIIFVSHNAQSIIQLCNRAILLHEKHIVLDDTPKNVIDLYNKLIFTDESSEKTIEETPKSEKNNVNFLESLKSDPRVIANADVSIDGVEIVEPDDESRVNILSCGESYRFKLSVVSQEKLTSFRIGFAIKNKKGLCVGGAKIEDFKCLEKGESLMVSKVFYCNFQPDHYFITVSITSIGDDKGKLFYRVHDAMAFKIEVWPDDGYWGMSYIGSNGVP